MPPANSRKIDPDVLFAWYYSAGPDRSLERLADDLRRVGRPLALSTLKEYSRQYGWQARVLELDRRKAAELEERALSDVLQMNERQAEIGRALQSAALTGLRNMLEADQRLRSLAPRDMARLAEIGTKIERLALGQATERRELLVAVWNVLVREIVGLFAVVNDLDDPDARAQRFAAGFDRIVDEHLSDVIASRTLAEGGTD